LGHVNVYNIYIDGRGLFGRQGAGRQKISGFLQVEEFPLQEDGDATPATQTRGAGAVVELRR
jgi:hypothetical protein